MDRRLFIIIQAATLLVSLLNAGPIRHNNDLKLFKRNLHDAVNVDQAVTGEYRENNLDICK
ncbi:hypothetical protein I4U23_016407 [Adineta vaga]|nr:hypothetical protein I4U23_016407 [Adineta vaga]